MLMEKLETYKMMLDEEKQDKADTLKLYEEVRITKDTGPFLR